MHNSFNTQHHLEGVGTALFSSFRSRLQNVLQTSLCKVCQERQGYTTSNLNTHLGLLASLLFTCYTFLELFREQKKGLNSQHGRTIVVNALSLCRMHSQKSKGPLNFKIQTKRQQNDYLKSEDTDDLVQLTFMTLIYFLQPVWFVPTPHHHPPPEGCEGYLDFPSPLE